MSVEAQARSEPIAWVLDVEDPGWRRRVCGLSIGLRAVLVLQRAGFARVYLRGAGADEIRRQAVRHPYSRLELSPPDAYAASARSVVVATPIVFSTGAAERMAEHAVDGGVELDVSDVDMVDEYLIDASTARGRALAGRAIRRSCRKPIEFSGIMSVLFKQSIVLQITRLVAPLPITPNQVTVLSLLVGVLALPLYLDASHAAVALGGFILFCNNLLDILDGQIARMKYRFTSYGEKLDNLCDGLLNVLLLAPIGIGLHDRTGYLAFEVLGWVGSAGAAAYLVIVEYYVFRQRHSGYTTGMMFWYRLDRDGNPKSAPKPAAAAPKRTGIRRFLVAKYFLRKDTLFTLFLVFGAVDLHIVPFLLMTYGYIQYGGTALIQFLFFHNRIRFVGSHKGSG